MVSWSRAFKGALVYAAWSIIWVIIGYIIIVAGILAARGAYDPIAAIVTVGAAVVIGCLIATIGIATALFKISAEITAEEVERRIKASGTPTS